MINLTFVGVLSLTDPPRDSVPYAVIKCKSAGVKVIMVTGDQKLTTASTAYQIGIIENLNDTAEIIKEEKKLETIEEAKTFLRQSLFQEIVFSDASRKMKSSEIVILKKVLI